ncbi:MAG: hypothetical protein ACO2PM_23220 [Pyrobaculum sp.]
MVSVRTRDVCEVDRRCGMAVRRLMMSLVEKRLARRLKRAPTKLRRWLWRRSYRPRGSGFDDNS